MSGKLLTGTAQLTRFVLRLDRFRILCWLVGFIFFTLMVPAAFIGLYDSQEARDAMAETMANPAMTAMVGTGDLANYTIGAMTAHQMLVMTAVVVGLMSILLVARHTRGDEEDGRLELIRSLPIGRLSYLNASLIAATIVNVLLAILLGGGLYSLGIQGMNLEGSLLYGAALGGTGLVFTGVTAVFAQLSDNGRGTIGLSIIILLFSYLFRGITDISNETLSWLSPLGWVSKTDTYSANNWGPIVLMVVVAILLYLAANYLNAVRDLERGFLPSKQGNKHASNSLLSPAGLAFRLQRTGTIAWAVGLFIGGASYGSVLGDLEAFFEGNDMMEQMLAGADGVSLTDQFIPMLVAVLAILATVPPLMAINKLRKEEKNHRLDHLLGRAVSRHHVLGSYTVIAVLNAFVMLSLSALGLWAAGDAVMEEGFQLSMVYAAHLSYFPAVLVMIGISIFFIGVVPKLTGVIWFIILYSFIALYFGDLFDLPQWMVSLSPFGHVPQLPIEEFSFFPLLLLSLLAGVLMAAGFIGFRRRDLE